MNRIIILSLFGFLLSILTSLIWLNWFTASFTFIGLGIGIYLEIIKNERVGENG